MMNGVVDTKVERSWKAVNYFILLWFAGIVAGLGDLEEGMNMFSELVWGQAYL